MDLSKLSDSDLLALKSGKLSNVSTDGLLALKKSTPMTVIDQKPEVTGSFGQNLAAGIGKGMTDMVRGVGQLVGINSQAEIDEARRLDAPLMETGGGMVGNVIGTAAPAVATAFIPGANTYTGAALAGALMGGAQPTAQDESRLMNTVMGGTSGVGGKFVGDKLAGAVARKLAASQTKAISDQSANAVRDAALTAGREAGYVVPPRMVQPQGVMASVLEGAAGRTKLEQLASNKNQPVTNALARKALGITDDVPITKDVLGGIRAKAGEAYEALRGAGNITADKQFTADLSKITQKFSGAAKDFPDLAKNEIGEIVQSVNKPQFSADSAIDAIAILRERAAKAYGSGDKGLGSAYKQTGQALEDAIERNLLERGDQELVKGFQAARKLIAKTYSVENALAEGGNVNARKLAGQLAKGKPLSDELETIAKFSANFGKATQDAAKVEPYSVTDAFAAAMLGSAGGPLAATLPLARPALRSAVLSGPYQAATTVPSYAPSNVLRLGSSAANNPRLQALLPGLTAAGVLNNGE